MAKLSHHENFDQLLLDAIEEGLSCLGETGNIKKQEMPNKLNDFSSALQIFGLGTRHLAILIMKNLHEKVGCLCKLDDPGWLAPDLTFTKYVELMKLGLATKIREKSEKQRCR